MEYAAESFLSHSVPQFGLDQAHLWEDPFYISIAQRHRKQWQRKEGKCFESVVSTAVFVIEHFNLKGLCLAVLLVCPWEIRNSLILCFNSCKITRVELQHWDWAELWFSLWQDDSWTEHSHRFPYLGVSVALVCSLPPRTHGTCSSYFSQPCSPFLHHPMPSGRWPHNCLYPQVSKHWGLLCQLQAVVHLMWGSFQVSPLWRWGGERKEADTPTFWMDCPCPAGTACWSCWILVERH